MAIQRIMTTIGTLALVPFKDLDSFSRTYENIVEYARRNKCKEFKCKNDGERMDVLFILHNQIPSLNHIALGQRLPMEWEDETERFLFAAFKKGVQTNLESILIDVTLCEDEYVDAVCVFRA